LSRIYGNARAKYFQLPYGDQGLFLTKKTFLGNGGFPQLKFMEDFEFVSQLSKKGKIDILVTPAITSGRRWKKLGLLKTTIVNQCIVTAYMIGVKPDTLYNIYYGNKKNR
jgi:hypothetical protein